MNTLIMMFVVRKRGTVFAYLKRHSILVIYLDATVLSSLFRMVLVSSQTNIGEPQLRLPEEPLGTTDAKKRDCCSEKLTDRE